MGNGRLNPEVAMREGRAWARDVLTRALESTFPLARQKAVYSDKALGQIREVAEDIVESLRDVTARDRRRTDWE